MVIVDHLTYRAIIIEILKLPRNCKMLLLLLKPLVKRSRVISICLVRLQQPSYFVFIKIKKMSVLLPLRHIYRMLIILHKVKKRAKIGCRLSPHKWSIVIPHIYHNEKETLYYHVDHITFFWSSLNEFIFLFPFFNGDITQSPSRESADCVLLLQKSSNWAHDKDIYQFTPKPIEIKAF